MEIVYHRNDYWSIYLFYNTLDFDYVGLIVWDDLYWSETGWKVDLNKNKDYTFVREIVETYGGRLITIDDRFEVEGANHRFSDINEFLESRGADMNEVVQLVLNTYHILFTRAKKGIRIWFKDKKTREHLEEIADL